MGETKNNYLAIAINDKQYFELNDIKKMCKLGHANQLVVQCQQVIEKLLKYLVVSYCIGEDINGVLNGHNLTTLLRILNKFNLMTSIEHRDLRVIKDFYYECRYPGDDYYNATYEDVVFCKKVMLTIYNETILLLAKDYKRNAVMVKDFPEIVIADIKTIFLKNDTITALNKLKEEEDNNE